MTILCPSCKCRTETAGRVVEHHNGPKGWCGLSGCTLTPRAERKHAVQQ